MTKSVLTLTGAQPACVRCLSTGACRRRRGGVPASPFQPTVARRRLAGEIARCRTPRSSRASRCWRTWSPTAAPSASPPGGRNSSGCPWWPGLRDPLSAALQRACKRYRDGRRDRRAPEPVNRSAAPPICSGSTATKSPGSANAPSPRAGSLSRRLRRDFRRPTMTAMEREARLSETFVPDRRERLK